MNTLFICTYEGLSGASYSLIGMVIELRKLGVNPYIVLLKHGKIEALLKENSIEYEIIRGYPWVIESEKKSSIKKNIYWQIKEIVNLTSEFRICKLIKEKNIDLIHINAFTASVGLMASKLTGIPIVWHIREFVEEDLKKEFWNKKRALKCLEKADSVITISQSVYNKFMPMAPKAKFSVVYNGIYNSEFKKERKQAPFGGEIIKLVIVGRIDVGKGHEEVIEAANILKTQGINNFELSIVGTSQKKEFYDSIQKLVIRKKLDNQIKFLGYREDVSTIFRESDIVIVASKAEAFGRVTVEAMMSGALVIGSNTAGTKELIGNSYGLLYNQGSSYDLAEKISYAIHFPDKMRLIAQDARKNALKEYTADINAKRVHEIYLSIVKEGGFM